MPTWKRLRGREDAIASDAESEATAGEVRMTRSFAARRELVFQAWVDPGAVSSWWAPAGFEVPPNTIEIDPRPGGRIHFTMVALEDGTEHPVRFEIIEIAEPELLVLRSEAMPEVGLAFPMVTRVVFEDEGEQTRVTLTQGPHTDEMLRNAQAGWSSCFDKLDALLAT